MASPCICTNLRAISRSITQYYDRALTDSGLRITQFSLLRAIARLDMPTIIDLTGEISLNQTTLTRNLRLLERDGLLAITPGEDRRTRTLSLTKRGHAAIAKTIPLWERAQAGIRARIGAPNLAAMVSVAAALSRDAG